MNTEEKAKAYDKAIEKARKELQTCGSNNCDAARQIFRFFPKLKESEDEKIRKAIVKFFELQDDNTTYSFIPKKNILAWLEKQGETFTKKDVDDAYLKGVSDTKNELEKQGEKLQGKSVLETWKIIRFEVYQQASGNRHEPNCSDDTTKMFSLNDIDEIFERIAETCEEQGEQKPIFDFKARDWYVSKVDGKIHNIYHSVDNAEPKFHEGDFIVAPYCRGKIIALTFDAYLLDTGQSIPFSCEDNVHRWTIENAKNGDVLCYETKNECTTFIYKNGHINYYCCYTNGYLTTVDGFFDIQKHQLCYIHPATKEQCDFLFQKITKAGYEWDSEKKELKKIDDEEVNGEDYGIDGFWHAKRILEKTLGSVSGYQTDDGILDHKAAITAVKKLYKQKPTWSGEDDAMLDTVEGWLDTLCEYLEDSSIEYIPNVETCINWLKSLKNRVIPQSKQEWSEGDEKISQWIISDIKKLFSSDKKSSIISDIEIAWLESLKGRIGG